MLAFPFLRTAAGTQEFLQNRRLGDGLNPGKYDGNAAAKQRVQNREQRCGNAQDEQHQQRGVLLAQLRQLEQRLERIRAACVPVTRQPRRVGVKRNIDGLDVYVLAGLAELVEFLFRNPAPLIATENCISNGIPAMGHHAKIHIICAATNIATQLGSYVTNKSGGRAMDRVFVLNNHNNYLLKSGPGACFLLSS